MSFHLYIRITTMLAVGLFAIACKQQVKGDEALLPTLSVSIEPQRYFAEKIAGNKFVVQTLVPAGSSPESFDPTPAEMVTFSKSKAFFAIGMFPFEQRWSKNLTDTNPDILLSDCQSIVAQAALHSQCNHADGEHAHGDHDPHIWNSPTLALQMAEKIYRGIVQIDPDNEPYYTANFGAVQREIATTDSLVKATLKHARTRTFIIYHPALAYFAEYYGLQQMAIEHNGKNPSPTQMASLIQRAKSENIRTVFIQPEFDKKNAEIVAREINANVLQINPLAYEWSAEMIKIARAIAER